MKKFSLLILFLAGIIPAMAQSKFIGSDKKKKKKVVSKEIVSVGIHRTLCFGQCPDYKIEITKKGIATYTGMRFTPDTGIFTKNIGKAQAKAIIDMCRKYRIDTCSEMYENRIPDMPGLNFVIKYAKGKKSIYSAGFGPEFLTEIATRIDEIGMKKDNTWKKIGMPKLD